MKKNISIIFILCLLCGCSSISENDAISKLDTFFSSYTYEETSHRRNNNTSFYSFYLPSDIQELEYNDTYHHLIFNSSDFVMNLNINYILCENVFSSKPEDPFSFISNYAIYEKDNFDATDINKFKFCLYKIDDKYFISFYSNKINIFGTTNLGEIDELVKHILVINNSIELDYDKIIDSYYSGTTIDYTQPQLELFNKYIPSEGTLEALLNQGEESEPIVQEEIGVEDIQDEGDTSSDGQ